MNDAEMEKAFKKLIDEEPSNTTHRRIFADWLDEQRRHNYAAFQRNLADSLDKCAKALGTTEWEIFARRNYDLKGG